MAASRSTSAFSRCGRSKLRQLALALLASARAVGQLLRGLTVLLDEPGVQGGQARQVANRHRARDRILTRQDEGDGSALRLNLVDRPQPPGQGTLLSLTGTFERRDLAAHRRDLGLYSLDARIEPGDLALLLG